MMCMACQRSDLQQKGTFVGTKHHRHDMTALFFQELFWKKAVDVTLDERCFANSIVSDNDDFQLSLSLLMVVRPQMNSKKEKTFERTMIVEKTVQLFQN